MMPPSDEGSCFGAASELGQRIGSVAKAKRPKGDGAMTKSNINEECLRTAAVGKPIVILDSRPPYASLSRTIARAATLRETFTHVDISTYPGLSQLRSSINDTFKFGGLCQANAAAIYDHACAELSATGMHDIGLLEVQEISEAGSAPSLYGCPGPSSHHAYAPGEPWLDWYRNMKPTCAGPRFKSSSELLAECKAVGVTVETPIYIYCFKNARASNTLLALKIAGVKNVCPYFAPEGDFHLASPSSTKQDMIQKMQRRDRSA